MQWNIIRPPKKSEILTFATTWMDLEGIMLSEINKSDREKQIPYDFTYMWNLNSTKTSKTEADSQIQKID